MNRKPVLTREPFYPALPYYLFGHILRIKKWEEKEFPELERLALQAAEEKKWDEADTLARAALYFYGVPGILLFHQVKYSELSLKNKEGEMLEQEVCNSFTYLFWAEKLLQLDSKARDMMQKYRDKDAYTHADYFKSKQEELLKLHNLSDELIKDCLTTAGDMAKKCLPAATATTAMKLTRT